MIMSWQEYVSPIELTKGREYLKSGLVANLERTEPDTFSAIVKGTHPYSVHVKIEPLLNSDNGSYLINASCTCPSGDRCKHIAATLFAIEQRYSFEKIAKELRKNVKKMPFYFMQPSLLLS